MSSTTLLLTFAVISWQQATTTKFPPSLPNTQYLQMLDSHGVRTELELTEPQIEEIEKLSLERKLINTTMLSDLSRLPKEERSEALVRAKDGMAKLDAEVLKVLLPHQQKRLQQLHMQRVVQAYTITAGLTNPRMIEMLSLSEQQVEDIKTRSKTVEEKLKERVDALKLEIEKAMDEARNDVLRSLTPEQRKLYNEAVGRVKPADHFNK